MKIVEIREMTVPISSPIRNAYIDFSKMTLSLVAVMTDVIRDGKPVVGYGFNSNGRYGQGKLMRERFIPRLLEAEPHVRFVLGAEDYAPGKPSPAGFLEGARRLGVPPQECLVFEDSAAGIAAARAAGMRCVALDRPGAYPQDLSAADWVLSDLAQFSVDALQKHLALQSKTTKART